MDRLLAVLGTLFGMALLWHPANSQTQMDEETAKLMGELMGDDAWQVYKHGYATGICDRTQTNLKPESRLYGVLPLYLGFCNAGVADSKTGNRRSEAEIKGIVLKTIKSQNQ